MKLDALWEEDEIEEPPESVRAAARAAFAERDDTAAVADLVYDSVVDGPPELLSDDRVLRFQTTGTTIELVVHGTGRRRSVTLRATPPAEVPVTARTERASWQERTDASGRAVFHDLPPSLLTFTLCAPAPRGPVRTAWVRL